MSGKSNSVGSVIKINDKKIGSLTSIDGLKLSSETTDVTTLDSTDGYNEFLGGFKSGGDVSLGGFLDVSSEGQQAMHAAFESQSVEKFAIEFPNGASWAFSGVVTGFETGANLKDPLSYASTIKVSGKPDLIWPDAAAAVNNEQEGA